MSYVRTDCQTIALPGGVPLEVEVARAPEDLKRGLKFRPVLDTDGMLFLYPKSGFHQFTMYQTLVPLDMLWMDWRGVIVEIAENAQPHSAGKLYGGGKMSSYGLELPAGMVRKYGLKIGQTIGGLNG
jgi:hypothetical protein